jgi:hypothetical protein
MSLQRPVDGRRGMRGIGRSDELIRVLSGHSERLAERELWLTARFEGHCLVLRMERSLGGRVRVCEQAVPADGLADTGLEASISLSHALRDMELSLLR